MAVITFDSLSANRTNQFIRLVIGAALGIMVTAGLFWTMSYLIKSTNAKLDESGNSTIVDFVRLKRDESIQRRQLKPEKPQPPESPPPQPPAPQLDSLNPNAEKIAISAVPVETDIEMSGGFSLGVGEGDYLPIVKVAPIYPQRALSQGLEGYCIVSYTVTRQGTIRDPFVIEDQCTNPMFQSTSIQASLKFKYKPRVIDGQAVEVPGVQNKFIYEIEK